MLGIAALGHTVGTANGGGRALGPMRHRDKHLLAMLFFGVVAAGREKKGANNWGYVGCGQISVRRAIHLLALARLRVSLRRLGSC